MDVAELAASFATWSQELVAAFGYIGIFVVNFVGSATVLLPLPSFVIVIVAASTLNPWLVGLSAGLGAGLGEITGYLVGKGGGEVLENKHQKWLERVRRWSGRHGLFPIIILFAALPLPADVIGIVAGLSEYNVKKFLGANMIGKTIKFLLLAWASFFSVPWLVQLFTGSGL